MDQVNLEVNTGIRSGHPPAPVRKIYKVSELTHEIRAILEERFPAIWVEGEISNFKRHSSGHIYFTLKDEISQLSAVFFARQNQFLKFEPKDGLHVIAIGRISVYDARGNYQLYVDRLEPKGLGALQLAFLQLKEKLEKEGLFDPSRKKEIPRYPHRIGIVTSPTGAALQDMLKVFNRTHAPLHILLKPVRVQGDGAALEITEAIREFNLIRLKKPIDVLIVGRGGGSLEDLWAFNEERVARAVFASEIPVISAVGHEIDWTICDLVADYRAHTPTAAAEHLVFYWNELEEKLENYKRNLRNAIEAILGERKDRLETLRSSYAFKQPLAYLDQFTQRFDEFIRRMQAGAGNLLERRKSAFQVLAGKLNSLSPLAVLERGYSITLDPKGRLVKSSEQVRLGDLIRTKLKDGEIESKVMRFLETEEKDGRGR